MREHEYSVYIMASHSKVLYIGITNDLQRRVAEHKSQTLDGFSKKYKTSILVYYEEYTDIWEAIEREKVLKNWRREKKITLIESQNPFWEDLA